MRRSIGGVFGMVMAMQVIGQNGVLPADPRVDLNVGFRNVISTSGIFDYNANTVLNELPLAILNGEFLERELRLRTADALSDQGNSLGYIMHGQVQWSGAACWGKRSHLRPIVNVAYHEQSGLSFTADQFNVAFFGNAAYQERNAQLSPSAFEQIRYQTIGAGFQHDSTGSFIRLDLVRGQSLSALDVRSAELFTGADGRVLRTSFTGDYVASDTAGSGFDRTNGLGAAISGRWNFASNGERPIRFRVGVDDLGFIVWNPNTVRIAKDTIFSYEGWRVENLFALDDVFVNEETVLDTFGLRYQHGSITRLMPFRVHANASVELTADWRLGLTVEQRYLPGYIPQGTVQVSRVLGSRTMLGTSMSYGGFGTLRFGLAAKHRFGEHILVSLSTAQVPAWISTRVKGLGAILGISVAW